MPATTMTSKGQITIPVKVRKALGLKPGVRIDFYDTGDGEFAIRPKTGSMMNLRGFLAGDGPPMTIDEMNQAVLDRAGKLDRATMSGAIENQPEGEAA